MMWRIASFTLAGGISAVLGFWVIDRNPPSTVIRATVATSDVKPGGDLQVAYEIVRYRSCRTTINRFLIDSTQARFTLDDLRLAGAPGPLGRDWYITTLPIPLNFAPGKARYRVVSSYVCNPIHLISPIITEARDIEFVVVL